MEPGRYKTSAFRVVPIAIKYEEDGQEKDSTLLVKYRMLTNEWFNSHDQVQKKIDDMRLKGLEYANCLTGEETKLSELQQNLSTIDFENNETKYPKSQH